MEKISVNRSVAINAPRERVWQALTDPAQLVQWFVPNLPGAQMTRDDSGKVAVQLGPMSADFAMLEVIDPLRQVSICSLPDKLITALYTLDANSDGTQVSVAMDGFELLPDYDREDRLQFSGVGWEKTLQNLNAFVNGAELPFPQAFVGPLFGYWRETRNQLAIERSIWINVPRERAWRAITDPKQLQQWFSPNTPWQLSALEVGGRFYVHNPETNSENYVEIIETLASPHQLVTRCIPEPPDTVVKRKTYTLKEENQGHA